MPPLTHQHVAALQVPLHDPHARVEVLHASRDVGREPTDKTDRQTGGRDIARRRLARTQHTDLSLSIYTTIQHASCAHSLVQHRHIHLVAVVVDVLVQVTKTANTTQHRITHSRLPNAWATRNTTRAPKARKKCDTSGVHRCHTHTHTRWSDTPSPGTRWAA